MTSTGRRPQSLDGYSWVDKGAGTVRIPIAEAMRLTRRARTAVARRRMRPQTPNDAAALVPTDASAGRQMERRRQ